MNIILRKKRLVISIKSAHLILGFFVILWLNAGNFTYIVDSIPSFMKLFVAIIWFGLSCYRRKTYLYYFLKTSLLMIGFVAIIFSSMLLERRAYYNLYFQAFLYIIIIFALFSYYFYFGEKKELNLICKVYMADMIIVLFHTFFELINNPILVRAISTSAESQELLLNAEIPNGIGGYSFCYALVFIMILFTLSDGYLKNHKIFKGILCISVLIFLFQAQITLAFIIYVIILLMSVFLSKIHTRIQLVKKILLTLLVVSILIQYQNILQWLIGIADESMAQRLEELLVFFQTSGRVTGSDSQSRLELYQISLQAFLQNPIVGNWGNRPFGCHSSFLDMLAAYGCFGVIGIVGFIRPLFLAKKRLIGKNKKALIYTLIIFSMLACINVVHVSQITLAVVLIIPITLKYMACGDENKE
ncbi:hypothetical protein [Faecalicatena fissicatena]|uniref:Lipid A core-O-antigen ligase and related enzymes n=1 Tax=Faecalicatena fissicatena TaxID=290055 RepID=A0ABS2E7W4_9FIRM|nr:hypothetical protein [Faecalicatena fissicatena]MBM6737699.1 hypothetical protein [Faecalicatena fissicatena]